MRPIIPPPQLQSARAGADAAGHVWRWRNDGTHDGRRSTETAAGIPAAATAGTGTAGLSAGRLQSAARQCSTRQYSALVITKVSSVSRHGTQYGVNNVLQHCEGDCAMCSDC